MRAVDDITMMLLFEPDSLLRYTMFRALARQAQPYLDAAGKDVFAENVTRVVIEEYRRCRRREDRATCVAGAYLHGVTYIVRHRALSEIPTWESDRSS